jgi:hypothetical protein
MALTPAKTRQYGDLRAKQATNALTATEVKTLEALIVELNKPAKKAKKRTPKRSTVALEKDVAAKPATKKAAAKK